MRTIKLHNGQSPGDVLVMTGAIRDLKEAFPDWEIYVDCCCPAIFENSPVVSNGKKFTIPKVIPNADNLIKTGYALDEIPGKGQLIFIELNKERKLEARYEDVELLSCLVVESEKKKNKKRNKKRNKKKNKKIWNYYHVDNGLVLFTSKEITTKKNIPEEFKVEYPAVHESGSSGIHFSNAYHLALEDLLGVKFKQHSLLPEVYLSDKEKGWMNQVEQETGYRGKFWLINAGFKHVDYILKDWGYGNWQELVNLLRNKIQFVQVGEDNPEHTHKPLNGVIDMVGKTDLRELIRLTSHSQGAVCHVALQMHLQAAFQKPCVVIAGGREPPRWEKYPNHRYLETNGLLECCAYDGCWLSGHKRFEDGKEENKICKNMVGWNGDLDNQRQRCMAMIEPQQVASEIMGYYWGGMLKS